MPPPQSPAEMYVVGDVHKHWRVEDGRFLERAGAAQVLFVGDLGDEDVEIVGEIARLRCAKSVILGNHDAWQSFSIKQPSQKLVASLDLLDGDHIAYEVRDIPEASVSIVGARPFSWGGKSLRSPELYERLYGIRDHESSARRIVDAAQGARFQDLLILAHNGPTGLGERTRDIWGKDFGTHPGGDWGDQDLELAIADLASQGFRVRCVVAGHMHDRLATPRGAQRVRFVTKDDTFYVNPAVVPRLQTRNTNEIWGHFVRLVWQAGELLRVEELWVDIHGRIAEVRAAELAKVE